MAAKVKDSKAASSDERLSDLEKRVANLEAKQRDHDKVCPYKQAGK